MLLGRSGLKDGDIFIGFSPERIDPGNEKFPIEKVNKVVSGINKESEDLVNTLYSSFVTTHIVSSLEVAEMSKILENTFRLINISFINEMAMICERLGINIWEVIDAAKTKPYGFMPFYPGPGVGGHCIPVDPYYLTWLLKQKEFFPDMIITAGKLNDVMPVYVYGKICDTFDIDDNRPIMVIGASYKQDVADLRESPALEIIKMMVRDGRLVEICDNSFEVITVNEPGLYFEIKTSKISDELIDYCQGCVVLNKNSGIDYNYIFDKFIKAGKKVVDTRRCTNIVNDNVVVLGSNNS
jgi:UDP-N-acetyl-D-glucosamine dehydrogenase